MITRPGCEKIVRYAFEYAKAYGRKKVTCMVKDNIMKLTDGLFHNVFKEIALQYPEIESNSQIIDIGSARLAANPNNYDVIWMETFKKHAYDKDAKVLYAGVGLGNPKGEDLPIYLNEEYLIEYNGIQVLDNNLN